MENQNASNEILQQLEDKFQKINQKTETHSEGLLWSKTMHPKYQRRIFFPELWSEEELKNWGAEN